MRMICRASFVDDKPCTFWMSRSTDATHRCDNDEGTCGEKHRCICGREWPHPNVGEITR